MSRNLNRSIGIIFLVLVWVVLTLGANLYLFSQAPAHNQEEQILHIARGVPVPNILEMMEAEGVVRDKTLFKYYLIMRGMTKKVRAGDYTFKARITPRELANELLTGDFKTYLVRIVEGWNIREIAAYLERTGFTTKDNFLKSCRSSELMKSLELDVLTVEGYLFPETYQMYRSVSDAEMIERFVGQFRKSFTAEMEDQAKQLGLSLHEVVTMASIIEKETGRASERKLVASVITNRLKKGIPLAMDPSVIYGIPNFDGNLTRLHLMTPTPYNTYIFAGLPPGPIANPGRSSLQAALNPAETNYLYFVGRGDGTHQFSATLEEHNQAVRKYQLRRGS